MVVEHLYKEKFVEDIDLVQRTKDIDREQQMKDIDQVLWMKDIDLTLQMVGTLIDLEHMDWIEVGTDLAVVEDIGLLEDSQVGQVDKHLVQDNLVDLHYYQDMVDRVGRQVVVFQVGQEIPNKEKKVLKILHKCFFSNRKWKTN